jgi:microcystin-dependent protein
MEGELSPLSPTERDLFTRASTSPLDVVQGEVKAYIDRMIEFAQSKAAANAWVVGDFKTVGKDLTAQTGVYVYSDESGDWLYCNGAAASKTTYADLYAFFGASAYAADSGGNFILPDCRGRALHFAGTNAATDLNDNEGTAEASRTPTVQVTASGTISNESSHTHGYSGTTSTENLTTARPLSPADDFVAESGHTHTYSGTTGAGSSHGHTFTGTNVGVTFPHLHAGSLLVKF